MRLGPSLAVLLTLLSGAPGGLARPPIALIVLQMVLFLLVVFFPVFLLAVVAIFLFGISSDIAGRDRLRLRIAVIGAMFLLLVVQYSLFMKGVP